MPPYGSTFGASANATTGPNVADLEIADAYNDTAKYPNLVDVAAALEMNIKTLRNRVGIMRRERPDIPLISRSAVEREDTPLSEKPQLFMEHWTAQDCVDRLRELCEANPDTHISRIGFNRLSGISESTWNRYFGTFEEFKRQASVKLSRGARQIELDIARHASRDPMDALNAEKRQYEGKYRRDFPNRFKSILVASDFHDIDCDEFVRRTFLDTAKRLQPELVVLNGDMLDLPEFGKYTIDPRTWDVTKRITWLHVFLRDLRTAAPNAEIVYLEGNHEFRILRHLAESTPALKTILADLHGFTVSKLLGLDEFEVNYVGKADLRAWTNKDVTRELHGNTKFIWDMLLADHFPSGIDQGVPGWNGHHHVLKVTPIYSRVYGSSQWVQIGAGHVANAEYCNGEKWNGGFLIVQADTHRKHAVFEPVVVRDFTCIGGQLYYRRPEETWHKGQENFPEHAIH
jgi:predicted phosphodiesterase